MRLIVLQPPLPPFLQARVLSATERVFAEAGFTLNQCAQVIGAGGALPKQAAILAAACSAAQAVLDAAPAYADAQVDLAVLTP